MKIRLWHLMPLALIALIAFAFFIWQDSSGFSKRDVVLTIEGPEHIETGQMQDFVIKITNNSTIALQDINVTIDLPSSLKLSDEEATASRHIPSVAAGSTEEISLNLLASVAESSEAIRVRMDYSPEGLGARFVSVTSWTVSVGSLDVSVIFDIPSVAYSGQEIRGTIHIVPNSTIEISPLYVRLDVPESFTVSGASPAFDSGMLWKIENLTKGETIKREFVGNVAGDAEAADFSIRIGRFDGITLTPLKVVERSVALSSSPVILEHSIVRPSGGVVRDGDEVEVRIRYINQSEDEIQNAVLEVKFDPAPSVAFSSVKASDALIDSFEKRIEWNKATTSSLRLLESGEAASVSFSFKVSSGAAQGFDAATPIVNVVTQFNGQRGSSLDASVHAENTLVIKLSTLIQLEQKVLRNGGPFSTSGPVPPRVGELTVYNVGWSLSNTINKVRSARVEAVLPPYVQWQGVVRPSNEDIQFFSQTRTLVWNIGTLDAGSGPAYSSRSVDFQLGLIPLATHQGRAVDIIENSKLSGVDTFTDNFVDFDILSVDTTLPDDPSISESQGIVQ